MTDASSKDIWLVVLGAVLALITSVVMAFVQRKIHERRTCNLLKTLLRHEIETITESLTRLGQQAAVAGFIPLLSVMAIKDIRQGYDRNRDWLILFKEDVRRDVFDFYTRLHIALNDAHGLETLNIDPRAASIPNWQHVLVTERRRLLSSFSDLDAAGKALLPRIGKA